MVTGIYDLNSYEITIKWFDTGGVYDLSCYYEITLDLFDVGGGV